MNEYLINQLIHKIRIPNTRHYILLLIWNRFQNQMFSCTFFGLYNLVYNFEVIFEYNFGYKWVKRSVRGLFLKWMYYCERLIQWYAGRVTSSIYHSLAWSTETHLSNNGTAWIVNFVCQHTYINSTLLHSFVILQVTETIFGMREHFLVSQGLEMKDLTASSGC